MCMETYRKSKNVNDLLSEIKTLENLKTSIEKDLKDCKKELTELMIKNECYNINTNRFTAKLTTFITKRFDSKRFKEENENLYNMYIKESIQERLTIKGV